MHEPLSFTVVEPEPGADRAAWIGVRNGVWPLLAQSLAELEHELTLVPGEHVLLSALDDQRAVAGTAMAMRNIWLGDDKRIAYVEVAVPAELRGRGIGSALLERVTSWCAGLRFDACHATVMCDDAPSVAFLQNRNFTEVERYADVELDVVTASTEQPVLPDGFRLTTLGSEPDLAAGYYEVLRETVPDVPGDEPATPPPFEEWHQLMNGPDARPDAWFVVVDERGESPTVAAIVELMFTSAQPGIAWNGYTGVRRDWRGLGLAKAAKLASLAYARANGVRAIRTENEQRNAPMRHINEWLGYRPMPTRMLMRLDLTR